MLSMTRAACLAGLLAASITIEARADDEGKAACMAAHRDAQLLRNDRHLQAARTALQHCAAPACPQLVVNDCTQWLAEVEQQQPSIVIAASDGTGRPLIDASAAIDGKVVATRLDGTAIEVDPGEHQLEVRAADGRSAAQRFVARQSEKARLVRIQLPAPASHLTPRPTGRRLPLASWVLGGVAIAAAIPWALFGALGWSKKASLDATCKGACSVGDIDDVRRDFNVADIAAGVTLAAVVGAVVVALLSPSRSRAVSAAVLPNGALGLFTQRF